MNDEKRRPAPHTVRKNTVSVRRRKRRRRNQSRSRLIAIIAAAVLVVIIAVVLIVTIGCGSDNPADTSAAPQATSALPSPTPEAEPTEAPTPEPTEEPAAAVIPQLVSYTEGGVRLSGNSAESMPYQVYVSKNSFTIAVLGIDENGDYTRLLHTWRTAIGTGNKTRAGSYKIDVQYYWYEWSDGGFTPYTSHLEGTKMRLHAPLHNKNKKWDSLWKDGYREIGSKETQGCLRTVTEGAAWVYFNCPVGTEVLIANDSKYESADPPPLGDSSSDPTRPHTYDDLEIPVAFFSVSSENVSLNVGGTYQLIVGGIMPDYEEISHDFIYVSGDESVVTVENGVFTAVGEGSTQVLVMADDINKAYRIINVTVSGN